MAVLKKTLKASSLIEVVVAAVIILASFTIAMSVLAKTAGENDTLHKLELHCLSNQQLDTHTTGEWETRGVQLKSMINNTGDLLSEQVIVARKEGGESKKKVLTRRRLIEVSK